MKLEFTQEERSILIDLLERRKEELRQEDNTEYLRKIIKQMLEKLDAD